MAVDTGFSSNSGSKKCGCPSCGFNKRNNRQVQIKNTNIKKIFEYRMTNPTSTISECAKSIGLSYPTVKKYWENKIETKE